MIKESREEKIERYKQVKTAIRLITAEFGGRTGKRPDQITSQDLLQWLDQRIRNPDEKSILSF